MSLNRKLLLAILFLTSCSIAVKHQLDHKYGSQKVQQRYFTSKSIGPDYLSEVKPILDRRCAVCHSCYDAPCQLKLTSFEGIDRGASKSDMYDVERLFEAPPTRLSIDASSTSEWRKKDFFPVLNERNQEESANLEGSLIYQFIELKNTHDAKEYEILPESLRFNPSRTHYCPTIEEFPQFSKAMPLWGMPYGLPKLKDSEFETLKNWIAHSGKLYIENIKNNRALEHEILQWEDFLNGPSNKEKLVARYIFEHLFIANIYFSSEQESNFRLIRSKTPPGVSPQEIPTRRPYDDPKTTQFFYRFIKNDSTLSQKSHIPLFLSFDRMEKWKKLFLHPNYNVEDLPSYEPVITSNPFRAFSSIPVKSRYNFMLEEAAYYVMSFIKGPVCRGRIAINVIDDRFWVFFANPDLPELEQEDDFLKEQGKNLQLPVKESTLTSIPSMWIKYSRAQKKYLKAKEKKLNDLYPNQRDKTIDPVWDGETVNTNAALTIFRHYDTATVTRGLIGAPPKTAWLIGYTLLERIYYLLVAGYDVFGHVGHNLNSRLFMDFLRMEGEYNFLSLLPPETRKKERDYWYRGAGKSVLEYIDVPEREIYFQKAYSFKTNSHKEELFEIIKKRLGKALDKSKNIEVSLNNTEKVISWLNGGRGEWVRFLAEVSFIRVKSKQNIKTFTFFKDRGFSNISTPFSEENRRRPAEDQLTVVKGLLGAHPYAFFDIEERELPTFVKNIKQIKSESDYENFVTAFGVRRNDPRFWDFSDWLHDHLNQSNSTEKGILDYNRLENR